MKNQFEPGDTIEGLHEMSGAQGRILAVEPEGYRIFWKGRQYREQDQFQLHSFRVIEEFYKKTETA